MFLRCAPALRGILGIIGVIAGVTVIAVLAGTVPAAAQEARWTAHTSMRQIQDVTSSGAGSDAAASEAAIWAATTGGVFRYVVDSGEISSYTASEGLHSVQTDAITYDPIRGVVWIGYRDGVLDRLDP
ncbi:MAG: hypothetical protein WD423_01140, partial [Rhodothermales bacterium]